MKCIYTKYKCIIILFIVFFVVFNFIIKYNKNESNLNNNLNTNPWFEKKELSSREGFCIRNLNYEFREKCLQDYFEKFTETNGPEKSFERLENIKNFYSESLIQCHYISHSIGHGALKFHKNDYSKAFSVAENASFLKNINTCGNGYFHGVMEQLSKDVGNKEDLIKLFKNLCNGSGVDNKSCLNFYKYHGIGHAALVQLENYNDALYVCDSTAEEEINKFGCYTGVFMEKSKFNNEQVIVKNGIVSYSFCNSLEEKYRRACYLEQSIFIKDFISKENTDNPIKYCKQITDKLNRMACVKYFSIDSLVANLKPVNIKEICSNTSIGEERRICLGIFASKMALSLDKNKGEIYKKKVDEVCSVSSFLDRLHCKTYVYKYPQRLFFVSDNDLIKLSIYEIIKSFFQNK